MRWRAWCFGDIAALHDVLVRAVAAPHPSLRPVGCPPPPAHSMPAVPLTAAGQALRGRERLCCGGAGGSAALAPQVAVLLSPECWPRAP